MAAEDQAIGREALGGPLDLSDWMEVLEPSDPRERSNTTYKRKRRRADDSLHRDRKTATHTTVDGGGKIAQLRKK